MRKGLLVVATGIILFLFQGVVSAACEKPVAKAVSVQGTVEAKREGSTEWQAVKLNDSFCPGDVIRVQKKSRAAIALANHPVLRLDENSTITLGGIKDERTSLVDLVDGTVHFFSRVVRNLEVKTAFVNAGVEGTEGIIKVTGNSTFISIFEGKVLASNELGSLALRNGQSAIAEKGKAPELTIVLRPWDAVRWTLYYQPIIAKAETVPSHISSASQFLAVGRVDEANAELDQALKANPNDSPALALASVIALAQNDKDKSLELANKSVESAPNSASARIALSYAQQAQFNLQGALESVKEAVKLEPDNALAWSRLAELELSFGRKDEALKAANKAVSLDPNLSRTHSVLGFSYLTQVKTKEAKAEFEKAIELDQAAPLPHLGLGLATIREGHVAEGRREIEVAASLDPENSLIRSYMGKAYFEEKMKKQAGDQFGLAEQMDPMDPTPYFYDAILKQTTNRPVEALHDMQKAMELNDNRAVYRSRLLLDQDLAARSASLARIYTDLGFEQLALVEGWKSENTDPANYSAHRFLADTYSALPRHEIARVSELLQSQLLQPLNITPIQPHLAEGNLFVIAGGGPGDASFNEFNPLFLRNGYGLLLSGIAGNHDTIGDEITVSALHNNVSLSAGQYHFETDGFRENNDLRDNIYNLFAQVSLSDKTSLQAEFRSRDRDNGDLLQLFFQDNFSPTERVSEDTNSARIGFHHSLSPGSDLIGSFIYQDKDLADGDPFLLVKTDEKAYEGELQHLYSSGHFKITSGAGFAKTNVNENDIILGTPLEVKTDLDHYNLYLYSYLNLLRNFTFTLGASGDFFHGGTYDLDKNQFNPKFGITWNPMADTTVRAAAFRTLKRTLVAQQTIEPTQVAGFNQFFDDSEATDAKNYGIAVDQKFSKNLYGGAEFTIRELDVPFLTPATFDPLTGEPLTFETKEADWKERVGRGYLYWTPMNGIALSAEYLYEKFEQAEEMNIGITDVRTHRFPLGVSYYHPCGFSARLKGTYFDQKGHFVELGFDPITGFPVINLIPASDNFWIFDASLSYRLPKRLGFVTVGAKNLFNKSFNFFDTDPNNPTIQPSRTIFGRITLSI